MPLHNVFKCTPHLSSSFRQKVENPVHNRWTRDSRILLIFCLAEVRKNVFIRTSKIGYKYIAFLGQKNELKNITTHSFTSDPLRSTLKPLIGPRIFGVIKVGINL